MYLLILLVSVKCLGITIFLLKFMNSLKENTQFGITDKSIIGALVEMTTKNFDWSRSINVHVILMTKLIIKLKTMGTDCEDKNDGYGCE